MAATGSATAERRAGAGEPPGPRCCHAFASAPRAPPRLRAAAGAGPAGARCSWHAGRSRRGLQRGATESEHQTSSSPASGTGNGKSEDGRIQRTVGNLNALLGLEEDAPGAARPKGTSEVREGVLLWFSVPQVTVSALRAVHGLHACMHAGCAGGGA